MKDVFALASIKGIFASLALLLMAHGLAGCGHHPFVGKQVNTRSPVWCAVRDLPQSCTIRTDYFTFNCKLSKGEEAEEYVMEGTATPSGLGGFTSLVDGPLAGGPPSRFELLVTKDGVITDSIPFNVLGTDLDRDLTFKRVFKSAPFDALTIWYLINVRG